MEKIKKGKFFTAYVEMYNEKGELIKKCCKDYAGNSEELSKEAKREIIEEIISKSGVDENYVENAVISVIDKSDNI